VLRVGPITIGAPAANEVILQHRAIGVNFLDTYHRSGLYPLPSWPHGIGVEAVGVVEAIGENVVDLAKGSRVAYVSGPGAYATRRAMPADRLVRVPDDLDDVTVAASLLKGMTVEALVRRVFPVDARTVALVHAAAGGVGLLLVQWLKAIGATVIGTVGTDEKAVLATAHGCDHTIVYTREDFPARVRELTNDTGVHVAYDAVGKSTFAGSLAALRRRGTLVSFGNASGAPPAIDPLELGRRGSLFLTRPTLFDYVATTDELRTSASALFERLRSGMVARVDRTLPLRDAAEAHHLLESRATSGSLVLVP
jgi:NADPH2:quinone reductase